MPLDHKKFTVRNEPFTCAHCGRQVQSLAGSCRDHCPFCLHGLHVDIFPGDRQNSCGGILVPQKIISHPKKELTIIYECRTCRQQVRCKIAADDDPETIREIMAQVLPPIC